jgi:hypothetical protein
MAAPVPARPLEKPAAALAGASLTPSPAMPTGPSWDNSSTAASWGHQIAAKVVESGAFQGPTDGLAASARDKASCWLKF